MNKDSFIKSLGERLDILNQKEKNDILNEYRQHIENKIDEGFSEEDAVKNLGSVEDISREILEAYSVDPDYFKKNKRINLSDEINDGVEKIKKKIKDVNIDSVKGIVSKDNKNSILSKIINIFKIIVAFIIAICVVYTVFSVIGNICLIIMAMLGYPLIGVSLILLSYNIISISFLVFIIDLIFGKKRRDRNEKTI